MPSRPHRSVNRATGFTGWRAAGLIVWSCAILTALIVAIFGVLLAACWKMSLEARDHGRAKNCGQVHECGKDELPEPTSVQGPSPSVVLDLEVNAVASPGAASERGPGTGDEATTQAVTINGEPNGAGPAGEESGGTRQTVTVNVPPQTASQPAAGGNGTGVVVLIDGDKTVAQTPRRGRPRKKAPGGGGETPTLCTIPGSPNGPGNPNDAAKPCAKARFLGRVGFEKDMRKILPSQDGQIENILLELDELDIGETKTSALLVIGHADECGRLSLGRRRARKVRKALRGFLKSSLEWKSGRIRIHAQAAGEDAGAPEGSCKAERYGTAGVYAIEGLK